MELIIAILIALGTITADEAKNYTADDMDKMETMIKDNGINDKMIEDFKVDGIIDLEECDI
ncbi:MAG: hypothetical protein ACI85F_000682 [Bacteroidia bacterium]|jgi:hypothetical protein